MCQHDSSVNVIILKYFTKDMSILHSNSLVYYFKGWNIFQRDVMCVLVYKKIKPKINTLVHATCKDIGKSLVLVDESVLHCLKLQWDLCTLLKYCIQRVFGTTDFSKTILCVLNILFQ